MGRLERAGDGPPESVGRPAEPAALPDHSVAATPEHDLDALAPEVAGLVEVARLFGLARTRHGDDDLEDRPLGRGALGRQVETCALAELDGAEAQNAYRHARRELAPAGGPGDLDSRGRRAAHLGLEQARVECLQAGASPPEAGERERRAEERYAPASRGEAEQGEGGGGKDEDAAALPDDKGQRQSDAQRRDQQVRRREPLHAADRPPHHWRAAHRSTSGRSCSSLAGPMPGTASSSSTERKAPLASR